MQLPVAGFTGGVGGGVANQARASRRLPRSCSTIAVIFGLVFVVRIREWAVARALYGGP
ncbi:hypothetical protein OG369_01885 [Streptomyces sp. NBC_01221]|uniref:hypothetical protein n=1 Tax=unclassified Streptomyces TaxID=2593676 RepID=UPI00225B2177|nr:MULTISPECIES: hypothetical protein [unclassified Streptomyces]MCX4784980.1 hypothetical protein [Streptomyces sp. NBC_01221]WSJ40267.1 hypothetical protein OG772_32615 [Streptomyces sp. NBC_01321]WSP53592.1 hypothetical protein OG306_03715 [Streptomyces sp. NBC_01241]WSU25741.1 hypothetical protein OG508_35650 [Streptomyces sp. NBC_01108]